MIIWETNELLTELSKDVILMGRETGWSWPGLAEYFEDLKRITQERILRSTIRGLREML